MWPFKKQDKARIIYKDRLSKRSGFTSSLIDNLRNDWATSSVSPDQLIAKNLRVLRARSREQYYNNDYAKRFVSMVKVNVVGDNGVGIQSKVTDQQGRQDKPAQKAIEEKFGQWSNNPNLCDFKRRLNFKELQDLVIATVAIDGESFVRIYSDGGHGISLKLIDPELIDCTYFEKLNNGNFIKFGIEYDVSDRVVAYHINKQRVDMSPLAADYKNIERERVPAKDIIHIYASELVDQHRGIPWMATVLTHLKMLSGYEEAALVAARIGAAKMGFFTSSGGEEYVGEEVGDQYTTQAEAGTFEQLPDGLKFESFDPQYPSGEFQVFSKQVLRGIAAGLGVSYNTLANDLEGVNFSSMRHGAVEERELWKAVQTLLINQFIRPVFERWLERQYLLKSISIYSATGQPIPLKRELDYYKPARFQGRRWSWVDPLKDIQARKEEIALNVTSISSIIRDKGLDPEEVFEEIRRDKELMNELGITPQSAGFFNSNGEENESEE